MLRYAAFLRWVNAWCPALAPSARRPSPRRIDARAVTAASIGALLAVFGVTALAQGGRGVPLSPGRRESVTVSNMSPVVVAQWFTARDAGTEQLALLVLWRGTPGWFLQPGGSGGDMRDAWIKFGDVSLSVHFDDVARTAVIQSTPVNLGNNNVVLVGEVDGTSGPRVMGVTTVPRAMPGSAGQIAPVLRGSAAIMQFLQCEAGQDSPKRALLEQLCLQNIGVAR